LLEDVAVELVGRDVADLAQVGLAVALGAVLEARHLPPEAEVVLQVVMPQQVLLHLEHARVVVAAHLDRRLAHLLLLGWDLAAVEKEDRLDSAEQQLAGERETGQAGSQDQDVAIVGTRHGSSFEPRTFILIHSDPGGRARRPRPCRPPKAPWRAPGRRGAERSPAPRPRRRRAGSPRPSRGARRCPRGARRPSSRSRSPLETRRRPRALLRGAT